MDTQSSMLSKRPPGNRSRLALIVLGAIMLGGFLLRLIFFTPLTPPTGFPYILDEGNYVDLAIPLSQGRDFVEKWIWLRPPGYPAFIAAFLVAGGALSTAIFAQVLLSVANIAVVYAIALEVFAWRPEMSAGKARAVALIAAGLMAANPHLASYASLFLVETLYTLAFSLVVWLLMRALRAWKEDAERAPQRKIFALFALAGLMASAAIFVRSLLLSLTPLLILWFWWVVPRPEGTKRFFPINYRWNARVLLPAVLFFAVMFAAILPWTVRNYMKYNRFMLVDTMAGYNLWQYNDVYGHDEIIRRMAAIENPVDRDKFATDQAIRAILSHPDIFLADAAHRFGDAWPVEYFSEFRTAIRNKYPGTNCFYLDLYGWAATAFYIPFTLLTLWGFVLAPGRAVKGLFVIAILHYLLTSMLTHMEFRYRMPLYPLMSVYGGWMLASIATWRRGKAEQATVDSPFRRNAVMVLTGVISLVFVGQCLLFMLPRLPDSIRFERRYLEGKSLMDRGDYRGAVVAFEGAEQLSTSCGCLYRNIGLAKGKLGLPDEELAAYVTAIKREQHDWRTRALLSDRLRAAGDAHFAAPLRATVPDFRMEQLAWAWDQLTPPPRSSIDIGGVDLGYIKGLFGPETEGDRVTYRWSTDHLAVRLAAPPGGANLKLKIIWHSLDWPGKPDPTKQVQIKVNGAEAGMLIVQPQWSEVLVNLPNMTEGQTAVVEVTTKVERPPGEETRLLGVALDSVSLDRGP